MATASQPASGATQEAQLTREYWDRVRGPVATFLMVVAAFFLFHPPLAQGVYFIVRSLSLLLFLGPLHASGTTETEIWLTLSGSALTLVIGATLCLAAYRRQGSPEILLLAFGSAFGLTLLELIFVFQERISAFYLVDAAIQVGLIVFWVYGWRRKEKQLARAADTSRAAVAQPTVPQRPSAAVPATARLLLP
jgi:hypothetical protein